MAAFKFKLESVLKQRAALEDAAQRDLAKVMRQRMILHNQLRSMNQTLTNSRGELTDGLQGRVDMDSVARFARYSGQVNIRAQTLVRSLAGVEKQVESARKKLIEATRQRQAIEKLRNKHHDEWKLLRDRREAAELDEIGVGQYAHRMMAESNS